MDSLASAQGQFAARQPPPFEYPSPLNARLPMPEGHWMPALQVVFDTSARSLLLLHKRLLLCRMFAMMPAMLLRVLFHVCVRKYPARSH